MKSSCRLSSQPFGNYPKHRLKIPMCLSLNNFIITFSSFSHNDNKKRCRARKCQQNIVRKHSKYRAQ